MTYCKDMGYIICKTTIVWYLIEVNHWIEGRFWLGGFTYLLCVLIVPTRRLVKMMIKVLGCIKTIYQPVFSGSQMANKVILGAPTSGNYNLYEIAKWKANQRKAQYRLSDTDWQSLHSYSDCYH